MRILLKFIFRRYFVMLVKLMCTFTDCGIKPTRIVGGSEVTPYSIPWQVGLVNPGTDGPFCGGTLISDRHVLTAAHCTAHFTNGRTFEVIVGEHDKTSSEDGTRHEVCRRVDHPRYQKPFLLQNDFSILHLKTPVKLGTRAIPACLPPAYMAGDYLVGKTMIVSGWGTLSQGAQSPDVLHSVSVPGISNKQCSRRVKWGANLIGPMSLCAGGGGGVDSCQGDSGGRKSYYLNSYELNCVSLVLICIILRNNAIMQIRIYTLYILVFSSI